ncbi:MAG: hypothetical protein ACK44V_00070, partial [Burkholderiales bacterium]
TAATETSIMSRSRNPVKFATESISSFIDLFKITSAALAYTLINEFGHKLSNFKIYGQYKPRYLAPGDENPFR